MAQFNDQQTTDPRGPFRTIVDVLPLEHEDSDQMSGDYTPVKLSCGHVAKMNFTFHFKVGAEARCFQCGQRDQQIQEARSVIRAIGGEHATGGDKRLALRRHFALDSFEAAYELQQAAEQPQTWQEAGRS